MLKDPNTVCADTKRPTKLPSIVNFLVSIMRLWDIILRYASSSIAPFRGVFHLSPSDVFMLRAGPKTPVLLLPSSEGTILACAFFQHAVGLLLAHIS